MLLLARHGRKSSDDQISQRFKRKAVRQQQRLGAAVIAGGQQLKQPALFGGHRISQTIAQACQRRHRPRPGDQADGAHHRS
jgi:hypothetical protein